MEWQEPRERASCHRHSAHLAETKLAGKIVTTESFYPPGRVERETWEYASDLGCNTVLPRESLARDLGSLMYLLLIIWDWDQIKIQFWSIKWRWSQTDEGLNCPVFGFLRLEIVSKDPGPPFLVSNLRTKGDDVTNIWRHSIPGVIPVPGHWHLQKDIAMRGSHWSDCHNTALWLATWQMESGQHPQHCCWCLCLG